MGGIFISYRRDDALWCAGRLFDCLSDTFGAEHVFIDVESLHPAEHFGVEVQRRVAASDVVLVLIGEAWLAVTDAAGRRRLDDPKDLVRLEVAAALKADRPIIPILVEGPSMPSPEQLPEDMRGLCDHTFFDLEHAKFPADANRLVARIREKSAVDTRVPQRRLADAMRRVGGSYAVLASSVDRFGARGAITLALLLLVVLGAGSHALVYSLARESGLVLGEERGRAQEVARYEERGRARMLEMFKFKGIVTDGTQGIQGAEIVVENPRTGTRIKPVRSVSGGKYNVDLGELLTSDEELVRLSVRMPGYMEFVDEFTLKSGFEYRSVLIRQASAGGGSTEGGAQ
jgi:hypothetical protein